MGMEGGTRYLFYHFLMHSLEKLFIYFYMYISLEIYFLRPSSFNATLKIKIFILFY